MLDDARDVIILAQKLARLDELELLVIQLKNELEYIKMEKYYG